MFAMQPKNARIFLYLSQFGRRISLTVALVFAFSFIAHLNAQQYGDKAFYLVDSLDLNSLSETDKMLIDTTLRRFHDAQHDTTALSLIEHLVDQCWNENVWPKYNTYLFLKASGKIRQTVIKEEQEKYASLMAGAISNMGYICDNQGNIPGALKYYHEALSIYERVDDKNGCASSFNNLGVLYSSQGDTTKALFYHNESLRLKKQLNDKLGQAMSLNNLGTLYKDKGQIFDALECFESSLRIAKEEGDQRIMAISYDNIGGIYYNQGYPTKAIEFYSKAVEIREINGEYSGVAFSLNNIASVYLSMNRIDEAYDFAQRSMAISEQIDYPMDIQNAAQTLYKIYKLKNDYEQALIYYEKYTAMHDIVHNEMNRREALTQSLRYEYEKKALKESLENQKIQELKDSQIAAQDATISQERTFKYAMITLLILMAYVIFISIRNYRQKQRDNDLIQQQKSEVESQKLKIEKQHFILEGTYKEISDSISYAKRIQQAILPKASSVAKEFDDCFVWYLPKNVVSGDFYWLERIENSIILAVADCTGHGVPGAMVSVVCHNALNRAVFELGITDPEKILETTRALVIETFDKSGGEVKDGMDIALIQIIPDQQKVIFAGANNNLYIIRQGLKPEITAERCEVSLHNEQLCTLIELKADKQPIGRFSKAKPFSRQELKLEENDQLYLFTDGLADQFGGPKGKKFKYQQFKEILVENHTYSLSKQYEELVQRFNQWKGELEQVDDICVIGVRWTNRNA